MEEVRSEDLNFGSSEVKKWTRNARHQLTLEVLRWLHKESPSDDV